MIQSDNTCILTNACNRIISHQRNKPVKNLDGVKYRQQKNVRIKGINKELLKGFMMWSIPFLILNTR